MLKHDFPTIYIFPIDFLIFLRCSGYFLHLIRFTTVPGDTMQSSIPVEALNN